MSSDVEIPVEKKTVEDKPRNNTSKMEIDPEDNESSSDPFDEEEIKKMPPFLRKLMMRKKIVYESIKRDRLMEE